jgi:hypothetical protein
LLLYRKKKLKSISLGAFVHAQRRVGLNLSPTKMSGSRAQYTLCHAGTDERLIEDGIHLDFSSTARGTISIKL